MSSSQVRVRRLVIATALLAGVGGEALAQAVERNPPPANRPAAPLTPEIAPPAQPDGADVAGPPLRGLAAASGADLAILPEGRSVVVAGGDLRLTEAELGQVLARHAGRPLTTAVVTAIQGDVNAIYRRSGYPFAAVVTPPQDLSSGVLRLRIVEFRIGEVRQEPEDPDDDVRGSVRLSRGDTIPLRQLQEDLVWLNRYPYRTVEAIFRPGAGLGETDLILRTSRTRPLAVFAGYGNTGSESTSWNRLFAGVQAGGLGLKDSLLAYQVTVSPEDIGGRSERGYLSQSLQASDPAAPRAQVDLAANWIQSHQRVEVFELEDTVAEASVSYRFALSNLTGSPQAPGDVWLGLEARRQVSVAAFGEVRVSSSAFNAYHLVAGYNRTRFAQVSQTEVEAVLRLSPGDLGDANSTDRIRSISDGRVEDAHYAYAGLSLVHARVLKGGRTLRALVRAQATTGALPRSEQFGLGGLTAARGYSYDDGAADQGLLVQGDLDFAEIPVLPDVFSVQPSLIADAAWGRNASGGEDTALANIGVAATARLAGRAELRATVAGALADGARTRAGDVRAVARLTVRF
jgi:hemolysin activation/secretion protein